MSNQLEQLRVQAVELRRSGKSRREIKEILRVGSNQTLNELLRGERPLMSTWRPNAKDDLRAKARELRGQGLAYKEIAAELGVSKSSVSLWVRDIPRPERLSYEECAKRQAAAVDAYWSIERQRREEAKVAISEAAAREIGHLSDRDILIAGAVAYWCEGAKNKPYRRYDRIDFINSDPRMIKLFLRFLRTAGVSGDRLVFQIQHPRNRGPRGSRALLARHHRHRWRHFQPPADQTSPTADRQEEHRAGLPRLPACSKFAAASMSTGRSRAGLQPSWRMPAIGCRCSTLC